VKRYLSIVLEVFCWFYFLVILAAFNSIGRRSGDEDFDLALFEFCCFLILIGFFTTGFVIYKYLERDDKKYELDQETFQDKTKE